MSSHGREHQQPQQRMCMNALSPKKITPGWLRLAFSVIQFLNPAFCL